MRKGRKWGRKCKQFYCGFRHGNFCCADCRRRSRCENPCLNDPSRCKLEEKRGRAFKAPFVVMEGSHGR